MIAHTVGTEKAKTGTGASSGATEALEDRAAIRLAGELPAPVVITERRTKEHLSALAGVHHHPARVFVRWLVVFRLSREIRGAMKRPEGRKSSYQGKQWAQRSWYAHSK